MVALLHKNRGASAHQIKRLNGRLPRAAPVDLVTFLKAHDGARPDDNRFPIGRTNSAGVETFFSVEEMFEHRETFDEERLSARCWPIAYASGGNLVCLRWEPKKASWMIVFWDHEDESETKLADSFSSFLDTMTEFDPTSVADDPDAIGEVHDPEWLAQVIASQNKPKS